MIRYHYYDFLDNSFIINKEESFFIELSFSFGSFVLKKKMTKCVQYYNISIEFSFN